MDASYLPQLQTELETLMAFKPITRDKAATKKLLEYADRELAALGMQTVMTEQAGFWSLIAGTKSLTHSSVLLQSHIDVVPASDELFSPTVTDGVLYGRGAYDMLFAAALFLVILRILHKQGVLEKLNIGVMLTSDEEVGGHDGVESCMTNYDCGVCILPDAGGKSELNESAKGVFELEITVGGASGHASEPHKYNNPIYRAADIVKALQKHYPNTDPALTTYSITEIHGGEALNQTPDDVVIDLDIRYVFSDDPALIQKVITSIATPYEATVKQLVCEPAYNINTEHDLVQSFIKLYQSTTTSTMKLINSKGSSDARFMTPKGIPVIMIRPEGGGLHAPNEHVNLKSFDTLSNIILEYIQQTA
jgi:succinyl-diaminopimelate desuccinylase